MWFTALFLYNMRNLSGNDGCSLKSNKLNQSKKHNWFRSAMAMYNIPHSIGLPLSRDGTTGIIGVFVVVSVWKLELYLAMQSVSITWRGAFNKIMNKKFKQLCIAIPPISTKQSPLTSNHWTQKDHDTWRWKASSWLGTGKICRD
jgi:hypothetical protein